MAVFALQGSSAAPGGLRGQLLEIITDTTPALGFEPRLQFDGPIETIDDRIAENLMPVLREALSNIAHHANAGHVRVAISSAGDVTLTISDDGDGIPDEVIGGRGLNNMATRARQLNGDFSITNQASGGTMLTWQVPATLKTPAAVEST